MSKHGVRADLDGERLVCKCFWEPSEFCETLEQQERQIEDHIKNTQAVSEYLNKRQATVFLKEVDNAWNE